MASRPFLISKTEYASPGDRFVTEETPSCISYPQGYRVRSIFDQVASLQEFLPGLNFQLKPEVMSLASSNHPPCGAEGWFVLPKWEAIAGTYGEAMLRMISILATKRKLLDSRGYKVECLRQYAKTAEMLETISGQQGGGNLLVVPAQFGFLRRGCSHRRAHELFLENEFGLGIVAVVSMLLTHPERIQSRDDLQIHCIGDRFDHPDLLTGSFQGDPRISCHPDMYYRSDQEEHCKINLSETAWVSDVHPQNAHVTAFLV